MCACVPIGLVGLLALLGGAGGDVYSRRDGACSGCAEQKTSLAACEAERCKICEGADLCQCAVEDLKEGAYSFSSLSSQSCTSFPIASWFSCGRTFTLEKVRKAGFIGKYALKMPDTDGKYCADEDDKVICDRAKIGDSQGKSWESFTIEKVDGTNFYVLKGGKNGKYCTFARKTVCNEAKSNAEKVSLVPIP